MMTPPINSTTPVRIQFGRLVHTGETLFELWHDTEHLKCTVSNEMFRKLIEFYQRHFDTVDVQEVGK